MITEELNTKNWDAYFIPGTNVLKNKLGITDKNELINEETKKTFEKLLELQLYPIEMNFDAEHLKQIHRYLFEDIYPFAGDYRNTNIEKNNSYFASFDEIEYKLKDIFNTMNEEMSQNKYLLNSKYDFACFLAKYYALLLNVHPFREGNGRTIREFIREYANAKSKELSFGEIDFSWSNVDGEKINSLIDKSLVFRAVIELEVMNALVSVENEKGILR